MSKNLKDHFDELLDAGYPLIAIRSHEEQRVVETFKAIIRDRLPPEGIEKPTELWTWSLTTGLRRVCPNPYNPATPEDRRTAEETQGPDRALEFILDAKEDAPETIFLLKDMHPYLEEPDSDRVVMRLLRDAASMLTHSYRTIILLSPTFPTPPDLEKDILIEDFPLPTPHDLGLVLTRYAEDLEDNNDIPMRLTPESRRMLIRALQGLTWVEAEACLAHATSHHGELAESAVSFILDAKARLFKRSVALEFFKRQEIFADIGGLDNLKEFCAEVQISFTEEALSFGITPIRGLLIVGVWGCGKSLTAKAVAGGVMPLLRLDLGAVFNSLLGRSEENIRQALKLAEAIAPAVLWIDEIDKVIGGGAGGDLDGGTAGRILGTVLTWMEETESQVVVVATANDIAGLDGALVRRFSEKFFVDLPTPEEREKILAIHLRKRGRNPDDFDLTQVAVAAHQYTGSEMEQIVEGGLRIAFREGLRELTTEDLVTAAGNIAPLIKSKGKEIEAMRRWADQARPASSKQESGHKTETRRRVRTRKKVEK